MAKYKYYSYDQQLMIPVSLSKQVLPKTFEYTLNVLIDEQIDLSIFEYKYSNDETGAPAYDPAILLKIILYAYSKGITGSRKIADLCRENIVCMALSADSRPHHTTIADFISSMGKECIELFTNILSVCYTENLIGKNMFAIDGCKISSNCSKEWSGTKSDLLKKSEKIKKSISYLVNKHKNTDENLIDEDQRDREEKSIKKLKEKAQIITSWLKTHEDRIGVQDKPIKSNIIDNESAKMATGHGVIQGYNGIAAVDDKHQLIVWAETYGDANENRHLEDALDGIEENCRKAGIDENIYGKVTVIADTGYHSNSNMDLIQEKRIDAYIPDNQFRKRDIRFGDVGKYKKQRVANWKPKKGKKYFKPADFHFDSITGKLICPAGFPLWCKGRNFKSSTGLTGQAFMGHIKNCTGCKLRSKCLRNENTKARQVAIFDRVENATEKMKRKIDSPFGRSMYSKRMGTVEPVFGHIRGTKKLDRFTLRGKKKVNNQWLLYCMVHNIGKINRYGK
ncbi:MAG: IS1182 family transposase [Bacteroidales bacterium]|nr:IS1182 family transposase [Bacteroidales bacterium]